MSRANRKQLAKALRITVGHVDILRRNEIIVAVNPGEHYPLFDLEESIKAYRAHRKVIDKKRAGSEALNASSLRRWRSRALLVAQKLQKLRDKTVPTQEIKEAWDTARNKVIQRLLDWPDLVADYLANNPDVPELANKMDALVRELLWSIAEDLGRQRPSLTSQDWGRSNPCPEAGLQGVVYNGHTMDVWRTDSGMRSLCIDKHYQKSIPAWFGDNAQMIEWGKQIIDEDRIENVKTIACHYS